MMTPLGSEGRLHVMVSCTTPEVANRLITGPATVQEYIDLHILLSFTILQCFYSECWITVWSSPSSIDCCHLHMVASGWSQSSQHMLSAPLSCSVHNGGAIGVAQSVSSDGSSLMRTGYCSPQYTQ